MQTALVTGGTGYIGRQLVRRLVTLGYRTHIIVRDESRMAVTPEQAFVHSHRYDGTLDSMRVIVAGAKPDVVFHLATLWLAEHNAGNLDKLLQSNIVYGTQLLEACTGTTKVFVNVGTHWQHFNDRPYNPANLYAATKQAFEDILVHYARHMSATTLKLFDVYGPDDHRPKLFNRLHRAVMHDDPLVMSSVPTHSIQPVHIDDVLDALCLAAQSRHVGHRSYAIRPAEPVTLEQAVTCFERVFGKKPPVVWPGMAHRPAELLKPWRGETPPGWAPKIDLEEGLRRSFRDHLAIQPVLPDPLSLT